MQAMISREERVKNAMKEIASKIENVPAEQKTCQVTVYIFLGVEAVLSNIREVYEDLFLKELRHLESKKFEEIKFTIEFQRMFYSHFYEDIEVEVL